MAIVRNLETPTPTRTYRGHLLTTALQIVSSQIDKRRAALLLGLSLASAATESIGLMLLVPILAVMTGQAAMPGVLGDAVARLGGREGLGMMLALFVVLIGLRGSLNLARTLVSLRVQRALVDGLRLRAWRALLHCDWRVLSGMRQTENASLLLTTLDRAGYGIERLITMWVTAITLAGVGIAALAISPLLTAGALVGGTLVIFAYRGMRRRAMRLGVALDSVYDRIHAELTEGLSALRVIKSFGAEAQTEHRLKRELSVLHQAERDFRRDNELGQLAMQVGNAAFLAVVVWVALEYWQFDVMDMLPMIVLFARGLPLLLTLQGCLQDIAYTRPAVDATTAMIARAEASPEPAADAGIILPSATRTIGLRDVTVQFEGRAAPALDRVSMDLPVHTVTALTGPSGAGKSTLADVIGGLLTPDSGHLLLDGQQLDLGLRRAWRSRVTYVQQVPILFSGTVRDNLLWASPNADDSALRAALAEASAEFVLHLPHGLDTKVGEHGHHFSGGERQRIILARAMLRAPELLILDEAANALDRENDAAIARTVLALRTRCTVLVIAHGGALEDIADRKVRIAGGVISENSR
ncbi:MAG: ATP-binding cassette domain-containing protein [Novosphingobium sp.]